jgi:predicted CoA-binding protein
MPYEEPSEETLRRIYAEAKSIAVVGASKDEDKPGHYIPEYLQGQNYRIIPVNPKGGKILGEEAAPSLSAIEEPVDVVDVFRPSEEAPDIAREAAAIGAKVLWLQEGIFSEDAAEIAGKAGMTVVMDLCMGATHRALGLTGRT